MKIRAIFALAIILIAGSNPAVSATLPDEQFYFKVNPPGPEYIGYASSNSFELRMSNSSYIQVKFQDVPNAEQLRAIDAIYECGKPRSKCVPIQEMSNRGLTGIYNALLSSCSVQRTVDCIGELKVTKADGTVVSGTPSDEFLSYNPQGFSGDLAYNLPTSGNSFVFDIPGLPHLGGTKYLVVAQLDSRKSVSSSKFAEPNLQLGIFAVSFVNGSFKPNITPSDLTLGSRAANGADAPLGIGREHPHLEQCVQQSQNQCAIAYPLPLDATFTISLKLSSKINGWLHGRVRNANASLNVDSNGATIFQVSAKPVVVPMVGLFSKRRDLTPELEDYYTKITKPMGGTGLCRDFTETPQCLRQQTSFGEEGMREFILWLAMMKERAIAAPTQWSIRTINDGGGLDLSCYQNNKSVSGIVMTNATNYISGPPVFNKNSQTLDYKVAAPHFLPNGEVFRGTYDLLIDSKVARCLYGFSTAPIQATISVLSADGIEQSSTTSVAEKEGWMHLSANGFTFSNPTLRVKMQQAPMNLESSPASSATSVTAPTVKPNTKSSQLVISCKKGKLIKKITGTKPKCPSGYIKI